MKIRTLKLQNYRGFSDVTIDLDRPLTVLFGENGSGKSSVLVALAVALSELLEHAYSLTQQLWLHALEDSDVRVGETEAAVDVELSNGNQVGRIELRRRLGQSSSVSGLDSTTPPVFAFYQATRGVMTSEEGFAFQEPKPSGVDMGPAAIADGLAAGALRFGSFFNWFKQREDIENELKVSRQDLSLEDPQLGAVRRAIAGVLPGYSGLRVQRSPLHLAVKKGELVLWLDQLSDGEKLMLMVAADLARRLAMVSPASVDPLAQEGIVLLDEVELHLHPSWQRRALELLTRTFPGCQFIVTTHSPQVISEVPNEAVVWVKDFKVSRPRTSTSGRDSNAILVENMGTSERPEERIREIEEVSTLLDAGHFTDAAAKIDALARELGEQDREVVGLRTMLHFLEGADEAHLQGE